jgi:hypothetical protein
MKQRQQCLVESEMSLNFNMNPSARPQRWGYYPSTGIRIRNELYEIRFLDMADDFYLPSSEIFRLALFHLNILVMRHQICCSEA